MEVQEDIPPIPAKCDLIRIGYAKKGEFCLLDGEWVEFTGKCNSIMALVAYKNWTISDLKHGDKCVDAAGRVWIYAIRHTGDTRLPFPHLLVDEQFDAAHFFSDHGMSMLKITNTENGWTHERIVGPAQ